ARELEGSGFGPGDEPGGPTFDARFRLTSLEVVSDADTDGDGQEDNHLPDALGALDLTLPAQGFALEPFNERLQANIDTTTPVFVDAHAAGDLALEVMNATVEPDGTLRVDEAYAVELRGGFDDAGTFAVGPGDIWIEIVVREGSPSVPVGLLEAILTGSVDASILTARVHTLISIDEVIEDVIEPSIPPEGWDLDRDGLPESKADVMALVGDLAPLLADRILSDGAPAISAVLALEGEPGE
ncbi:MAG: hypothetical protein ABMB14_12600, partial [Myxococcota bacterium]